MARLCRSCCGSMPFGMGSYASSQSHRSSRTVSSESASASSEESWESSDAGDACENAGGNYQPPNDTQVQLLAKKWIGHVQQRAAKIWSREQVMQMFETIARSVNFTEDPILGDPSPNATCVQWHGDISQQQGLPVLLIQKPNNPSPTSTYVCRVLAFLFADDASLKLLKQLGNKQSEMNCGNTQCVRLSHLVGYTTAWAQKYQAAKKAPPTAPPKGKVPKKGPPKANGK
ncbi:conserved hypothetical protein [Neospora caninum Liverpool]|uniref:Uncharacterized protein n=1 Tax=Neospora caninum (strain Liverpool) TaxID=572307 RepID=F0VNW9_NEOCL|nr:conserved hypothetical protein [Neospora caninum Liverpool]CBZ55415.1 conserved hypothetical protein [Neospora caninum Liverpool]CEL70151.1 TPA: hypothetical protein BN1204_058380 [Neospora caninum Liverpool]|eukprot:XP_003885443.1 conserved hypothetical protein [Neospora caninum Liverpool]